MLPTFLRTLKEQGYHVVHMVPGPAAETKTRDAPPGWTLERLVLLEASCKACADRTHAFEEAVLLHALRASRRKLKIRGKKRKRNEPTFALAVVKPDGTESVEWRTLDVHPTVLFLPKFDAPVLLTWRPEWQFHNVDQWALLLGGIIKSDVHCCSPVIDIAALAQLIAKIAHGFAVWQFGLDGFVPMLVELILHDFNSDQLHPDQFHLVGGDLRNFAPQRAHPRPERTEPLSFLAKWARQRLIGCQSGPPTEPPR